MTTVFKIMVGAAVAAAALAASASAASADKWVRLHNQTSVVLYGWQSSPSKSNRWGPDRLVSKQIPPGYASTIDLNNAGKGCLFDFRATFIDGDVLERYNVNVCGGIDYTYSD